MRVKIRVPDRSKSKKIMLIFFVLSLIFIVLGAFFQFLWVKSNGFSSGSIREEKTWENIKRIKVLAANLDFTVKSWDNSQVQIVYHNDAPLVFETTEYDELIIKQREDDFRLTLFTLEKYQYKATLYLPSEGLEQVSLSSKRGFIDTCDYSGSRLDLQSINGNVHAKSGAHPLYITTKTGNIYCELNAHSSPVRMDSITGNTVIYAKSDTSVKLSFQTQHGNFVSDFFDSTSVSVSGGTELVYGDEPVSVFVTSVTGNLSFYKKDANKEF